MKGNKRILLDAGYGPEGIQIYLSDEEGEVDWSECLPALYITASVNGALVKLGPFMRGVRDQVVARLDRKSLAWLRRNDKNSTTSHSVSE